MKNLEKFLGVIVIGAVITTGAFAQEASEAEGASVDAVADAAVVEQAGSGGAKQMALSVDLFPLVKGMLWKDSDAGYEMFALAASFERLVRPHYSVGAAADLYTGKLAKSGTESIGFTYFGLAVHGRYYPQSAGLDKFFIDAGLGFNTFTPDLPAGSTVKYDFTALTLSLKAGYKVMLTPGLFFEPSMAFVYAKTPGLPSGQGVENPPTPLGWQPGLGFGGAF
jgi:hypothetical protein